MPHLSSADQVNQNCQPSAAQFRNPSPDLPPEPQRGSAPKPRIDRSRSTLGNHPRQTPEPQRGSATPSTTHREFRHGPTELAPASWTAVVLYRFSIERPELHPRPKPFLHAICKRLPTVALTPPILNTNPQQYLPGLSTIPKSARYFLTLRHSPSIPLRSPSKTTKN